MLLKALEIQGFKTFPEKTTLLFNKGITAVVGPNGSGKSNISDAIRWTLGEQSIKTLRCAKMEDVVFSGSEKRKPRGFAEVVLKFDNKDRTLDLDEDDVSVTRRYYRSGESEYLINGKLSRLKDVHELFMDTGLGRDGYSMISQGKIDSIVSSRSEDRREIFEEAAGISKYRYRKAEAERKLNQAEENLLRLRDILKELSERLEPLKDQAEKARKYLELSDKKKALEIGIWLFSLDESSEVLKEQSNKLDISRDHYNEIELTVEKIIKEAEDIDEKIRLDSSKIDNLKREMSCCEDDINNKINNISVLENDVLHNSENIERINLEISGITESIINVEEKVKEKKNIISKIQNTMLDKQNMLDQYNKEINAILEEINESSKGVDDLSAGIINSNQRISFAQANIEVNESNLEDLYRKDSGISTEINSLESKMELTSRDVQLYFNKTKELKEVLDEKNNILAKLENNLINKKEKNDALKSTLDKFTLDEKEQIRKINLLQELDRNLEGFSGSVKFIMKQEKDGNLKGICGPVSSIITVPREYVIAVETALGYSMQNIVVDTNQAAKEAIMLLKEKNAGRATFLPVETISGNPLDSTEFKMCQGFINICSDLCTCDKKFSGILRYLLGRTIVADNLDNATQIAKRFAYKFKVVTLDGQIVNAGGSLTGGSKVKGSGALSRLAEINRAKELANNAVQKAEDIRAVLKDSVMEEQKLIENVNAIKSDISSINKEYSKNFEIFTKYSLENENLERQLKSFIEEKNLISSKIENLKLDKGKYVKILEEEQIKVYELESNLNKVTCGKENLLSQKDELNSKIYKINMEILSLNKDIESINAEVNAILSGKLDNEKKCGNLKSQIENFKLKNIEVKEKITFFENEVLLMKKKNVEKTEEINKLNDERINFEKNITILRQEEREKLSERENIALEVARLEERKVNLQIEYDQMIANLWDEYELTRREAMQLYKKIDNVQKAKTELNTIKSQIKNLGTVNVSAIEEYKDVFERYNFMHGQILDVEKSKDELYNLIIHLTGQMKTLFTNRFNEINENFLKVFKELFNGGKASIKLTQPDNILESGIDIFVQPPGKIVTQLESLSGGEKALVAIALYFAIMRVSPSPFCVLDEIEAALDEINVSRFASYLRKMNKSTQFIVISHRRGTMEEADVLYGVTMQDEGISKVLELKTFEFAKNFIKG